jgi:membrane complex biogenesis BtpA family protein
MAAENWLERVFGVAKPIIGMVHFPALPGAPLYDARGGLGAITERVRGDVLALQEGGIDGLMFCNENDRPYSLQAHPETIAVMGAVIGQLLPEVRRPFGVDVLWDPVAAIALAKATGAGWVREVFTGAYAGEVGIWNTRAGEALRYRRAIDAEGVRVLYNINAEFAAPLAPRPLAQVARATVFSSLPDALCVSGPGTGQPVDAADLREARSAAGEVPVLANTGVNAANAAALLPHCDGAVVGTSLKRDGVTWNAVDPGRVAALIEVVRAVRVSAT